VFVCEQENHRLANEHARVGGEVQQRLRQHPNPP
jgi:hypothetical protein